MRTRRLLAGCATGAVIVALASPAAGQALQGDPTVVAGSAVIATGAGTTNVILRARETVIDWTTFERAFVGTTDFLPVGMTATFRDETLPTYTVLNRIFPLDGQSLPIERPISLNGTVTSILGQGIGGNVWFYNAGGILVGAKGVFNVGSLILTTNDIQFVPGGTSPPTLGSIYGPGGLVQFRGSAGSTSSVDIQPGAQLNALGANAYVALVAPRIVQGGTVRANGQVAYLAAEQLDMRINAGLFDFTLLVGTTDENGVDHYGTTTGPASTAVSDVQQISMVALPKNDALTMLLSGSIGYDPAASAANEGSSVVLAAGFAGAAPLADPGNRLGSIAIGSGAFRNKVTGFASDTVTISPSGTINFQAVSTFHALNDINLTIGSEQRISAASDLILNAGAPGLGGNVLIDAYSGGDIDVARQLSVTARPVAFYDIASGDAVGGTITISADDATIHALEAFVEASAVGGVNASLGGEATGGRVDVDVHNNGLFSVDNFASFNVRATGGGSSSTGGNGQGGTIELTADNGTMSLGSLIASADGLGGAGNTRGGNGTGGGVTLRENNGSLDFGPVRLTAGGTGGPSAGQAGDGFGGRVAVSLASDQQWDDLQISADATAGRQLVPGTGLAGSAAADADAVRLTISGTADLTLGGDLALTANSYAGIDGAAGFSGHAGGIAVDVDGEASLAVDGTIYAHADALLDSTVVDFSPTRSATQTGGTVSIAVSGSSLTADRLDAGAHAYGLSGSTAAGTATGGLVSVSAVNAGSIDIDNGAAGEASAILWANGYGSPGPIAGDAFGGTVRLLAEGGSISVNGILDLSASGLIGSFALLPANGEGFDATGGAITIDQRFGVSGIPSISSGSLRAQALGDARVILNTDTPPPGGEAVLGNGGIGTGGDVLLTLAAGDVLGFSLSLDSSGFGGASAATGGATAFQSGAGIGGASGMVQSGGTADYAILGLLSDGLGGGGGSAATGTQRAALAGAGTGGAARLQLSGGTTATPDTVLSAVGTGAGGMDHGGTGDATDGGSGTGGLVQLLAPGGSTGALNITGSLSLTANGIGGVGGVAAGASTVPPTGSTGDGGDGIGGDAAVNLADGVFSLGTLQLEATGTGGYSGDASTGLAGAEGGEGRGGQARFELIDSPAGPAGARRINGVFVDASGLGGFGSTTVAQGYEGDLHFTARVRDSAAALDTPGDLSLRNSGSGLGIGGIAAEIAGAPLTVGGTTLMSTTRDLEVTAVQPLHGLGDVTLNGQRVHTTGLVQADGALYVTGFVNGIDANRLSAGGTTTLDSFTGPILVHDLASAGLVTARGASVDISSLGGLSFADLDAFTGLISVQTLANLNVTTANAATSLTLRSTSGALAATGALDAGGALVLVGNSGITAGTASSGGTTLLQSPNGAIAVTALSSSGAVTAQGRSVDLDSPGALSFADARATAGAVAIDTQGNLALAQGGASGGLFLASANGSVIGTGPLSAGNNASVIAPLGVTLASLASGGTTLLRATGGAIDVDSLTSGGPVTALGRTVDIVSPGALTFADLDATAGPLTVVTVGNLGLATADASGAVALRSTGGALTASGAIHAGGALVLSGNTGLTAGAVDSGGTTLLQSPNGAIAITALTSSGAVTAQGRSVDLDSPGALSFADARATAGAVAIDTQGNLALAQGGASGGLFLASANGAVTATGPLSAGNNASVIAPLGVTLVSIASGGTTLLRASGGAIDVDSLTSAGPVTAFGRTVDILSPAALVFADLDATAGPLTVVVAGNLGLTTADASGAVFLRSTGGGVGATGAINAGGSATVEGLTGITLAALNSGETTELAAPNGTVDIDLLVSPGPVSATGRSIDIVGSGPLTFTTAEALNDLAIFTSGDLAFASVGAGINLDLTSTDGSLTATGDVLGAYTDLAAADDIRIGGRLTGGGHLAVTAGGALTVIGEASTGDAQITADHGISMTSLHAGELTSLIATNGPIVVPELTTGGVLARGLDVEIASSGSLSFSEASASSGDVTIRTAGNLRASRLFASGAIELESGRTFTLGGEARAATIGVDSSDIEIDDEVGQLGVRGVTSTVTLRNNDSESHTFIGGQAQDSDYSLDRDEAARLFADGSITLLAIEDITVGDLALSFGPGSANIGTGGRLEISTPDYVHITGDVMLRTASADDTFRIDPRLVELDTSTGSISMFTGEGGGGTPLGRLQVIGDTIAVASTAALTQLRTLTDMAAINTLLDTPGGSGEPLRAGTIAMTANGALFIQNSGASTAFADRRGFAAGGLEITTATPTTRIAINGQIITSGGPVGGLDTAPLVRINQAAPAAGGRFDSASTINGCAIGSNCAPVPPPEPEPERPEFPSPPTSQDIESPAQPGIGAGSLFVAPLVELAGTDPLITPPLVDEPITGVGNDDLWEPPCEPGDDGVCAEEDSRE